MDLAADYELDLINSDTFTNLINRLKDYRYVLPNSTDFNQHNDAEQKYLKALESLIILQDEIADFREDLQNEMDHIINLRKGRMTTNIYQLLLQTGISNDT